MTETKFERPEMVYVVWFDAMANLETWVTHEESEEWSRGYEGMVEQIGWVVQENEHYLLLASRLGHINDGQVEYGGLFKIPIGCIKKKAVINSMLFTP